MTQVQKQRISRRAFVQKSGLIGGASLLAAATGATTMDTKRAVAQTPDEIIDIAIVGAGVSGVYCAWRLQEADPTRNIVVFEAADHVGGRLLSVRPPGISNMVAELGGMRILPAVQPRIARLLDVLNGELPAGQQIETYDFPVDELQNIAYLRGVHLRLSDFTNEPEKVPYQLSFLERGKTAGDIIVNAIEQIVPGITDPALDDEQRRQMVQNASFDGIPLYKQGFWNVLLRIVSEEAYQLAVDAGGYSSIVQNWNAADAIPWFLSDFGIAPAYKGFTQGFQSVPMALADLFTASGGEIRLNTPLLGFDMSDDTFELQVQHGMIRAESLILAMPRRALDLLAPTSPPLREIQTLIASVTPQPLFKIFTTYDNSWWRSAGFTTADGTYVPVQAGRTVTDLPIQQTYYWPQDDGSPATDGPSMLMASYHDGGHVGFWDGLRPQRGRAWQAGQETSRPDDPFVGRCDVEVESEWCKYQAPQRMVDAVARQLATVHDLSYTPQVQNAAYRDWGDDPFGGGWNAWNIGIKSWEIKERIVQPFDERALYICGEAYSDAQGWVEGALQTADIVLDKFGLASF